MTGQDRPERDRPDDVDAAFSEIVADLRAEGFGAGTDQDEAPGTGSQQDVRPEPVAASDTAPNDWRSTPVGWDSTMLSNATSASDDDEHFVPPEPPPLPRLTRAAVVVLVFFGVGLLLLIAPGVLGIGPSVATPLGILALAAGLGFLLLRSREGTPPGSDPENGAQV